jgi:hypothetical protein
MFVDMVEDGDDECGVWALKTAFARRRGPLPAVMDLEAAGWTGWRDRMSCVAPLGPGLLHPVQEWCTLLNIMTAKMGKFSEAVTRMATKERVQRWLIVKTIFEISCAQEEVFIKPFL